MNDKPKSPAKKTGRPKTPPPPPALGIADRAGNGYKFTVVLAGLKVNGKRYDPQVGAEILARMLEDGLRLVYPDATPKAAMPDPDPTTESDDADVGTVETDDEGLDPAAAPDTAMAAAADGQDGANGRH